MAGKVPKSDILKFEKKRVQTLTDMVTQGRGRKCSEITNLSECYAECEVVHGWLFNSCRDRNFIKQFIQKICGKRASRADLLILIDIMKIGETQFISGDLQSYSNEDLCSLLEQYSEYYHTVLLSENQPPWTKLELTKTQYVQSIALAKAEYQKGNTVRQMIDTVAKFLINEKTISTAKILFIATLIIIVIVLPVIALPYVSAFPSGSTQLQKGDINVPLFDTKNIVNDLVYYDTNLNTDIHNYTDGNVFLQGRPHEEVIEIPGYNMEVIGPNYTSILNAKEIAQAVKAGFERNADVCKLRADVCLGNLGIPRQDMPQVIDVKPKDMIAQALAKIEALEDSLKTETDPSELKSIAKALASAKKEIEKAEAVIRNGGTPDGIPKDEFMAELRRRNFKFYDERLPVGLLRASQKEFLADKSFGIADSYLKGKFNSVTEGGIIVVKEYDLVKQKWKYTVLDGHHRFAALIMIDPERIVNAHIIEAPTGKTVQDVFDICFNTPGVFKADLNDNIIDVPKKKIH